MTGYDIFNTSSEGRDVAASFHGVGSSGIPSNLAESSSSVRKRTPITIPKQGSRPREPSSSRHKTYGTKTRRSKRPVQGNPFARDTFSDDDIIPGGSSPPQTARRSGPRPSPRRPTTPQSDGRHSSASPNNVSVVLPTEPISTTNKGKARAYDPSPSLRISVRQQPPRRASQSGIIQIDDDSDDDIREVRQVAQIAPRASSARMSPRLQHASGGSSALAAKDALRKVQAERLSPAGTEKFYTRSKFDRPDGPIRLEEPSEIRKKPEIIARASPEHVSSSHSLDRSTRPKPPQGVAARMKTKRSSPQALTSNGSASRASPREHADQGIETLPSAHKRRRAESSAASQSRRKKDLPGLPHEVRLGALVISDIWSSRKDAHPVAVFQTSGVHLGYLPDTFEKIPYSDIREVAVSSPDVESDAILSLILRNDSPAAKRMQELFPEFDPLASGGAGEINLIAKDTHPDFEAHKQAIEFLLSKSDHVSTRFLTQPNSTTKVNVLSGVRQADWPRRTIANRHEALSPEARASKPRTKIVPGAGRSSEGRDLKDASAWMTPARPRSKAFDIQPPSPPSASSKVVKANKADTTTSSTPSALLPLSVPKTKSTDQVEPKARTKLPFAAAPHDKILTYPYEGTNAITLQASDFERLMDGELLNDLNIEFGLKLMLEDIRKRDSKLADSIHIFNTFFYKLLNTPPVSESFSKLRKWTGKAGLDLFSKKYVVVPINEDYHWYLAVIVNPGALLRDQDNEGKSLQDKNEVEPALPDKRNLQTSPSPTATGESGQMAKEIPAAQAQSSALPSANADEVMSPPISPLRMPLRDSEGGASTVPTPMDLDDHSRASTPAKESDPSVNLNQTFVLTFDSLGSRHPRVRNVLHEYLWREALDKKRFPPSLLAKQAAKLAAGQVMVKQSKLQTRAQEAAQKDREKAADISKDDAMDESADGASKPNVTETEGVRKIQVQDTRQSPGSVGDELAKPIDEELIAKTLPIAKHIDARVPSQPNFCDCGIYLLHYFERFFSDPDRFLRLIVEAKAKREIKYGSTMRRLLQADEGKVIESEWQSGEVSGKREYWRHRIVEMMKEWEAYQKQRRAMEAKAAAEAPKQEPSDEEKGTPKNLHESGDSQPVQVQQEVGAQGEAVPTMHASSAEEPMQVDPQTEAGTREEEKQADAGGGFVGARSKSDLDDIERHVHAMASGADLDARREVDNVLSQVLASHAGLLSQDDLVKVQKDDQAATLVEEPDPMNVLGDITTPPMPEHRALAPSTSSNDRHVSSTSQQNHQSTPTSFGASLIEHLSPPWDRLSAAFSSTFHASSSSQVKKADDKQRDKNGKTKEADGDDDSTVGDSDSSVSVTEVVGPSRSPSAPRNASADL